MKRILFLLTITLFLFSVNGLSARNSNLSTVCYKSDMHCTSCEKSLFEYLRFEKGVKDLKVDFASNTVKVVFDKRKNSEESLAKAIGKKGYQAEKITLAEYSILTGSGVEKTTSPEQPRH